MCRLPNDLGAYTPDNDCFYRISEFNVGNINSDTR